jgi:hypothetical protein
MQVFLKILLPKPLIFLFFSPYNWI